MIRVLAATALLATAAVPTPAQGRILSPRDSTTAWIASARLDVNYGRPSKRGRRIFGGLVPYDQVWRTGANEATRFSTTRDLFIGGARIPAGTYSIYTIPRKRSWTLIINKQTDQWGTTYDQSQDLARITMKVRSIKPPVERFTIEIVPRDSGGVLKLIWDDREASVAFTVK